MKKTHRQLARMIKGYQSDCDETPSEILVFILNEQGIKDEDSQVFTDVMILFEEEFGRCTECGWIIKKSDMDIEDKRCYDCMYDETY